MHIRPLRHITFSIFKKILDPGAQQLKISCSNRVKRYILLTRGIMSKKLQSKYNVLKLVTFRSALNVLTENYILLCLIYDVSKLFHKSIGTVNIVPVYYNLLNVI